MKKLLFLFALLLLPLAAGAETVEIDGISYNLNSKSKTAEVTEPKSQVRYSGSISIPETIVSNGITHRVTSIGMRAFAWCTGLTSVTIPNSVADIGANAFWECSGLNSITIPNSVTSIGEYAFASSNLSAVTIPNSVRNIKYGAFADCGSLTSIIVEAGNTKYDSRDNCNGIIETESDSLIVGCQNTTIPNSVTCIGDLAFIHCSNLTSVTIPSSVTSIGFGAFSYCSGLTTIKVEAGNTKYDSRDNCDGIIETESNTLIVGCPNTTIPNTVTSIGNDAFLGCVTLTSFTIPQSVTSIGSRAFFACEGLTEVTIPKRVTTIGEEAFYGCPQLTKVTSFIDEPFSMNSNTFYYIGADNNDVFTSATLYVPSGCKAKYEARRGWKNFKNIVEMEEMEDPNAALDSIKAELMKNIAECKYAIDYVAAMLQHKATREKARHLYDKLYDLSVYVIKIETDITSATTLEELDELRMQVMSVREAIARLEYEVDKFTNEYKDGEVFTAKTPEGVSLLFKVISGKDRTCQVGGTFYQTNTGSEAFVHEEDYKSFNGSITIPEEVNGLRVIAIGVDAFMGCENMTAVTLPSSVKTIGPNAFYFCKSLTSMKLPEGTTEIGERAFAYCQALESIDFGKSLQSIGERAFIECAVLKQIELPATLTTLRNGAFVWCYAMEKVVIHAQLTAIPDYAFTNCDNLRSINIPETVTSIGTAAFNGCDNLESLAIPAATTSIDENFFMCRNFSSITVNPGNPVYDSRDNCNALIVTAENRIIRAGRNTVIPEGIVELSYGAFSGSRGLTAIALPSTLRTIGSGVFYMCQELESITIPESVDSIGSSAFWGCSVLTKVYSKSRNPYAIDSTAFDKIPAEATLYVPAGTKAKYMATEGWKNFTHIVEEVDSNAIARMEAKRQELTKRLETCQDHMAMLMAMLNEKDPQRESDLWQHLYMCQQYTDETMVRTKRATTEEELADAEKQVWTLMDELTNVEYMIKDYEPVKPLTVTTVEGVELALKIVSEAEKTVQVGDGQKAAASQSTTGSVTIPATAGDYKIVAIAKQAFDGCKGIEAIHIPASVTSLADNFLGNCRNLTSLTVAADNPVYSSPANSNVIVKTEKETLVAACNSTVLPEGIETIGSYAFAYCDAFETLDLPDGVSIISNDAFYQSSVRQIATGNIKQIGFGTGAFNCSKVETFYLRQTDGTLSMFCNGTMWRYAFLPDFPAPTFTTYVIPEEVRIGSKDYTVSSLGSHAFYNCSQLTDITIPATITAIEGKYAFGKCTALRTITSYVRDPFAVDGELFVSEVYSEATLYVPAGTKAKYEATEGWKNFTHIVEMAPEKGDLGGKGYTDVTDVVAAINHILGEQPLEEADAAVVDMNSDGEVNVADIILLVKLILEQGNSLQPTQAARGSRQTVDLTNYTAMQLSLDVPIGSRLSGIRLAGRNSDTHQLMYQQTADGSYTVVVWSMDNQNFSPVDGQLIEVNVDGGGEAVARSVLLADHNGGRLTLDSLPVGTATGIGMVASDGTATADVYDLRGHKVLSKGAQLNRLPKGVYVIDGKKVTK